MITHFILLGVGTVLSALFSLFLPIVTIRGIPIIGEFLYNTLITMVGIWNAFMDTFPYAEVAWEVLIYVILPFEIVMFIVKLILGSRTPSKEIN